jgi:hypothetical protein
MLELKKQPETVDIKKYKTSADSHSYVDDLNGIKNEEAESFLNVGIDMSEAGRSGRFLMR